MGMFDGFSDYAQVGLPIAGAAIGTYFGGPVGGIAGASAGSAAAQMWANQENLEQQRKQYRYQKQLQKDIFAREDNSVFRRTQDMIRAGLSPTLAAGSGAGAGAIVSTKAPQREFNPDVAMAVLNMIKMKEDVSNTVAQRKLIEAQTDLASIGSAIKNWDLNKFVEWNLPSNASGLAKTIRDLGSLMKGIPNQVAGPAKELDAKIRPEGDKNPYQRKFTEQKDPIKEYFQSKGWLPKNK